MKAIPIKTAAAICGVEPEVLIDLARAEELWRTGSGEGKVRLSDVVNVLGLKRCPTCGATCASE